MSYVNNPILSLLNSRIQLLTSFVLLLVLSSACSQPIPTKDIEAPPAKPVDLSSPPPAILHVGELAQEGGMGSYCWTDGDAGVALCADTMGVPTVAEPLPIGTSLQGSFELLVPGNPQELVLMVIPVSDQETPAPATNGLLFWQPVPSTQQINLPLLPIASFRVELDPGKYVLNLFARWPKYGDVTYGFPVAAE